MRGPLILQDGKSAKLAVRLFWKNWAQLLIHAYLHNFYSLEYLDVQLQSVQYTMHILKPIFLQAW
jgi:hypothetical protein